MTRAMTHAMDDAGTDTERQASITLSSSTLAAGQARRFVTTALREWAIAQNTVLDVVLATSELVTNAAEHGLGEISLHLVLNGPCVRLRVWDASPEPPVHKQAPLLSERNRGLAIVAALSSALGHQAENGGKWVWADFPVIGATGVAPTARLGTV